MHSSPASWQGLFAKSGKTRISWTVIPSTSKLHVCPIYFPIIIMETMTKTSTMKQCIADCKECERICKETLAHCTKMGGKHAEESHICMLKDCTEVCNVSTKLMERGSDLSKETCNLCAKACDNCAGSCETVDPNDEKMKSCAEVCRKCAASCRKMEM